MKIALIAIVALLACSACAEEAVPGSTRWRYEHIYKAERVRCVQYYRAYERKMPGRAEVQPAGYPLLKWCDAVARHRAKGYNVSYDP